MERTLQKEINWVLVSIALVVALYFLSPVLPPFVAAFIIAYLGIPLVERLMRAGLSRTLAATLVFIFFLLLVVLAIVLVVPMLERQLVLIYDKVPDMFLWVQQNFIPWVNEHFGLSETMPADYLKKTVTANFQQTGNIVMTIWKALSHSGLVIIGAMLTCLLVPVVTFYLLRDWDQMWLNLQDLFPARIRARVVQFAKECNEVLGAFLRGQLIVVLCLGFIYSLGLWLAGLDSALVVGLFAGIINIVPYLGLIVGLATASIMMLLQYHDGLHVLYAVAVFLIGSGIDNTILTPNLIGGRIGLHPVAVIFAVLAGGHLFGFVGVLLALPVASIIMVVLRHLRRHFTHSHV